MSSYSYNYDSDKSHKLYKVLRPLAGAVSKTKYRIHYIGSENVPTDRGVILASNHITALDPVIIGSGCPRELHFMAKQELFEKKVVGWFLSQLNAFPVDRHKFDYLAINHSIKLIKDGGALGIFPEGTRSDDFKPHKGKGGICYIAKECKCDIVPVSIYTSDGAKVGTKLTVRYGEPIKYEELNFDESSHKMKDLRYATGLIMERITKLWELGHGD
jgi:1-acyl-sn-glycerol-3-phosphate acyltransferase